MKASFLDLRKRSKDILRALEQDEIVTLLYRGCPKAEIRPLDAGATVDRAKVEDHPAFGLWADRDDLKDPRAHIRRLRRSRFHGL